jgi:hypothetical protein
MAWRRKKEKEDKEGLLVGGELPAVTGEAAEEEKDEAALGVAPVLPAPSARLSSSGSAAPASARQSTPGAPAEADETAQAAETPLPASARLSVADETAQAAETPLPASTRLRGAEAKPEAGGGEPEPPALEAVAAVAATAGSVRAEEGELFPLPEELPEELKAEAIFLSEPESEAEPDEAQPEELDASSKGGEGRQWPSKKTRRKRGYTKGFRWVNDGSQGVDKWVQRWPEPVTKPRYYEIKEDVEGGRAVAMSRV